MQGALRVLESLAAAVGIAALWFVVLFVLPLGVFLYLGLLVPLTGRWRERWRARKDMKRNARRGAAAAEKENGAA